MGAQEWSSLTGQREQKVSPGARRLYERYTVYRRRPTPWMQELRLRTFGTRPERTRGVYIHGVNANGEPVMLDLPRAFLSRAGIASMLHLARQLAEPFGAEVTIEIY